MSASRLSFLALLVAVFAWPAAAQDARDFQLPPTPAETQQPQVQGPVDTESGNLPVRPRVIQTPRPVPLPTPTATVTPRAPVASAPVAERGGAGAVLAPAPQPRGRAPSPPGTAPTARSPASAAAPDAAADTVLAAAVPDAVIAASPGAAPPIPVAVPRAATGEAPGTALSWPIVVLALLAAGGAGWVLMRRRRRVALPPVIERPAAAAPPPAAGLGELVLDAAPVKLTRSVAYATLRYRAALTNRGARAIGEVVLRADLVSARGTGDAPPLAGADTVLPPQHRFHRIAPGQTVVHEGEVRLPLSEVVPIRQGRTPLLVPLLRLRLDHEGDAPLVRNLVVGQGAAGAARVAPFRLDEGPRSFAPLAARALA